MDVAMSPLGTTGNNNPMMSEYSMRSSKARLPLPPDRLSAFDKLSQPGS